MEKETEFYTEIVNVLMPKINLYTKKFIPPFGFACNVTFALRGIVRSDIIKIDTFIEENIKFLQNTSFKGKLQFFLGDEKAEQMEVLYHKESDYLAKTTLF
jgi:hypothetical protein